ncbi:ADP-glyceromanno-heptose 6-epimerase [Estrella lausannensis]|uniref:ADP-L-glycero-D-manno-heptose-6-epimerase n=1 Tax=Estrella lausannensis TaxID=483423 RepID=A0A0H5E584_9BACT|nr:ADP-glyceromanno-heptose 6-epimerase [Estrella lausannensis]CRX38400.1 ADP-L-glycero-D-manno-heptose-6-epimerase [Estrella lausannensis]
MRIFDDQFIVITGAAGFIGSCLVRHFNDLGIYNLVLVDELGHDEKWKNLTGKRFVELIDKKDLFSWIEGRESEIEAFVHLGAISDTQETNASLLLENNTRFSIKLCEFALKHGHRFVYASSAATYGDGTLGFSDSDEDLYKLKPLNMYGFSKQLFDQWLFENGLLDQVAGLKFFNIFGPNEWHKGFMASVVLQWTPKVLQEGVIKLFKSNDPHNFADGEQKRDFLYVKDAVKWVHKILTSNQTGILNIGSGEASSWNDLAKAIFAALNKTPHIEYVPMPEKLAAKYQNYTCAETEKLRHLLGSDFNPTPLAAAVNDYINNHILPGKSW